MKRFYKFLMLLAALMVPWVTQAQTLESYGFSTGVDASKWVDMTGATQILSPTGNDGLASSLQTIGFSFSFAGTDYTQYSVNTDGNLRLGGTVTGTGSYSTPFSSSAANTNSPKINAFGCDGYGVSGSHYVKALLHVNDDGDSMLVVEFCMGTYNNTTRENLYKWQIHLCTNGNIDIVYPDATDMPTTAPAVAHQCGICVSASDGWVISASSNTAQHFTNGSSVTNAANTWFDANRYYSFIHPNNISCPAPTGITVSNITTDGATLSWTAGGTESQWELTVGDDTYYPSDTTYTLTGLNANTIYTVSVRAICSAGDTSFASSTSFRTLCTMLDSLPYTYGFEGLATGSSSVRPDIPCWHHLNNGTQYFGYPYVSSTNHTGTRSLYWYNTTTTGTYGDYQMVVLPGVDTTIYPINTLQLTFWARPSSTSYYPVFKVGVMTDPNDATTFQEVATVNVQNSTAWQVFTVSLGAYTGAGNFVAVRMDRSGSSYYAYTDDFTLEPMPNCPSVTDLTVEGVTPGGALLTWGYMAGYDAPATYEVTYDSIGGTSPVTVTSNNPYMALTNLEQQTSYKVYVRANCDSDGFGAADSAEFTTGPFSNIALDGGTGTSYYLPIGNYYNYSYTQQLVTAEEMGSVPNVLTGIDFEYGYTSATTSKTNVTIYLANTSATSLSSSFVTYDTSFHAVYTGNLNATPGWNHYEFDSVFNYDGTSNLLIVIHDNSGSYNGSSYVFKTHNATGKGRYIQNDSNPYSITSPGTGTSVTYRANMRIGLQDNGTVITCASPVVAVVSADTTSVDLAWIPGLDESSWDVEYRLDGATTWTTAATGVTTTSYTVTDLLPGTNYMFRVSHECDNNTFSATVPFSTPCVPASLPYTENFDGITLSSTLADNYGLVPNCWDYIMTGTSTYTTGSYLPKVYASSYASSSPNCLYLYGVGYFMLPEMSVSLDSLQMTFNDYTTSASYGLIVGVMEGSIFVPVDTIELVSSVNNSIEVVFSNYHGNSRTIAFRNYYTTSTSTYYSYHYIDDIVVDYLPSCPHPTNGHTLLAQGDTLCIGWTAGGQEEEWDVFDGTTHHIVDADSLFLTNLSPSTHYTFEIRAICGPEDTSAAYVYSTRTACGPLTALPYVQDFEHEATTTSSNAANFAPCWHHLNNGTSYGGYPYVAASTTYNHTSGGYKGLYYYAYTTTGTYGDYMILVLPEIDTTVLPINTLMLTFWAKTTSTSYEPIFYAGVMTDPNVDTAFQYYDTIYVDHSNTEWHKYTVTFDQWNGEGRYVAIRANRPSSYWYAYMDDIVLDVIPDCPAVEDVAVLSGPTSAIVNWSSFGSNYNGALVEYRDTVSDSWTSVTVTGTYATLTGLTPAMPYTVRVSAICDESNSNPVTTTFATGNFGCLQVDTSVVASGAIGTDAAQTSGVPVNSAWGNTMCQSIYTAEELTDLGIGGVITDITFTWTANSSYAKEFSIYMTNTTASEFNGTNASDWVSTGMGSLVYSGAHPLNTSGAVTYHLTTPFMWDGSSNLCITTTMNQPAGASHSSSGFYGNSTQTSPNVYRTLYKYQDSSPLDGANPASVTPSSRSYYRPSISLTGFGCSQQTTCAAPVVLVSGTTATTASLVWTPGNADSVWNVYYRQSNDASYTLAASNVTATTYTFTGLNSGSLYYFKVENVCGGESYSMEASASTECAPVTLPLVEDFNSWGIGTGVLPNCWSRSGSYSNYTYISSSQNMSGATGGSVYMYQGSSTPYTNYASTLILPELDTTLYQANQTQLVFSTKYTSTSYGRPKFEIGVVTDPHDFNTFVPVDTVQHSGGINRWETFEVSLANYTGNGAYVAMRTIYDSAYCYPYVDDITLELIPTCPRPDTLYATNATTNSVDLGWHDRAGALQWIIEYGPVGFQLGTGTQVVANTNPYTLTGLPAAYQGEFYVKAVCGVGDTGDYSRIAGGFNTSQPPATLPYNYDFENAAEWANWQTSSNNADINWYRGTAVADSGSYSIYVSADSGATYKPYNHNAIVNVAAFRDVDFGPVDSSYTLSFRARAGGTPTNYWDGLMVFLVDPSLPTVPSTSSITTPWGNVNDLYRIATVRLDTTWQTYEASFDTIHGVHRVAFFWFNQNTDASAANLGEPAAVDNIHIKYSTCPRPVNLEAVATTGNTATLTWDGAPSATYQVVYRQDGSNNHVAITNTNSIVLTGLNSAATHYAWVRKLCGVGDTSLYSDGISFETQLCDGAVVASTGEPTGTAYYTPVNNFYHYSLTETIIDSAELVGMSNITTIAYDYAYATASTVKTDVTIWLQPTNKTSFSSSSDIVALDTTIAVQVYQGNLNCQQGWNYFAFTTPFVWDGHSNVLVIVDDNSDDYDGSAYVFNTVSSTDYKTIHYYSDSYNPDPLTPSGFSGSKGYLQYRVHMQLISCGGVACNDPIIDTVIAGENDITFQWTGSASSYEVAAFTGSWQEPTSGTTVFSNTATVTGLTPGTAYAVGVRAICGEGVYSEWVVVNVTTLEHPCLAPTNVTASNVTLNGATLSWTPAEAGQTHFEVRVSANADTTYVDANGTTADITGLYHNTEYSVAVRAVCGENNYSDWSAPITFRTATCQPVQNVTVGNITVTTATVNWTANGSSNYELAWGYPGTPRDNCEHQTVNTNSYTISGLEEHTSYVVYVRSVCAEGVYSDWTDGTPFMTERETGIEDVDNARISLYPNPASSTVTLTGIEGAAKVTVVDMNGREVYTQSLSHSATQSLTIDVSQLAQGAYFVRITGERVNAIRKLIVR